MKDINQLQRLFKEYLEKNRFDTAPGELYQPINYILDIGGKRIRPVLLLMSYNLFREDVEAALPAALTIELFHNFSLIHDDIMDQAPLRRGKASVHTLYGMEAGILSGDMTLILAYDYLLKYRHHKEFAVLVEIFNEVARRVCEGQQYDMNFEQQETVDLALYLKMIEFKTAALLDGALRMGAILAGRNPQEQRVLGDFGRNIGIAFQLQDDILDSFGDPEKVGKKVGGDIVQNKKTYLVLKTLEVADNQTVEKLKGLMKKKVQPGSEDERAKIVAVKKIFEDSGVLREARSLKEQYQEAAFSSLALLDVPEARKAELTGLANALLGREA